MYIQIQRLCANCDVIGIIRDRHVNLKNALFNLFSTWQEYKLTIYFGPLIWNKHIFKMVGMPDNDILQMIFFSC